MIGIMPQCASTIIEPATKEWRPPSFSDFLAEVNCITTAASHDNTPLLFRGHRDRRWLLDSTFVRMCKQLLFGVGHGVRLSAKLRESLDLHRVLLNLLLLKYGVLVRPSTELLELAETAGVDPWFELMKRHQQFPEDDRPPLKGSHLVDWTQSADIGIYFANSSRIGEGALYVLDVAATGRTLQTIPVGAILEKMDKIGNQGKALGCPLLFCPPKQIHTARAANQQAMYVAQMDLRVDLEEAWRQREMDLGGDVAVLVKIVLPAGCEREVDEYLTGKGVTAEFVFPDTQ